MPFFWLADKGWPHTFGYFYSIFAPCSLRKYFIFICIDMNNCNPKSFNIVLVDGTYLD